MLYMFVHTKSFVACVPVGFFFHCCSFSPFWPLAFLIFWPPISCFSSNEICLLCFFIQRCSSFSVIHVSKDVFIQSDLTLLLFFSLKCPGGHAISRQKTPCCIWVAIPVDWVIMHWFTCGADGSAYGHVIDYYQWCTARAGDPLQALCS